MRVDKPAEVVWDWMSNPRNLFAVNLFHAEVDTEDDELRTGATLNIDHDFFGFYQQKRYARIREVRPYYVSFGEYKQPDVPGKDPFPHVQSFQVVPVDDESCIVVNRISGSYVFPGSSIFGEWLFKRYIPTILDDDNQVIAVGCGAMTEDKLKVPAGLLVWPLFVYGAKYLKKSTRRDVIERSKARAAHAN